MSFILTGRKLTILPLVYQSQEIDSSEWITLFTLCLAPLIAHIIAGTPSPVYLHQSRPRWHEQICQYNPTSILWRYAAIADRRIRAKSWDRTDLAPTNAIFWTNRGWDGSEAMIASSAAYCYHFPDNTRISIFSKEMITTIIVTSQGVQAMVLLLGALDKNKYSGFTKWMAVDAIFFPLAMIGLLRLCCAFWLNDDYGYSAAHSTTPDPPVFYGHSSGDVAEMGKIRLLPRTDSNETSSSTLLERSTSYPQSRFKTPSSSWGSKMFRSFFLFLVICLLILDTLYLIRGGRHTTTSFVFTIYYMFFLTMTIIIFMPYFWQGKTTSTIIPCITSTAYKIYTGFIFGITVATIVIACVETRRTPCGKYTSGSGTEGDLRACWSEYTDYVSLHVEYDTNSSGLAVHDFSIANKFAFIPVNSTELPEVDFKGTCFGKALSNE
ncbi:hypothetical protein SNK05_013042 [Fusarium graminearum]|nr:hypothetical protein FG05_11110 [Fusarium graminearum]